MQFLLFAIIYPFIWLLSKLPMKILYLKSDFFYILIYYVFGYRKEIVLNNLKLAFPNKKKDDLLKIRKQYYKHLMDLMVETIKAISISKKEILKRYTYKNPELLDKYANEGRSIALLSAHQANWEWMAALPLKTKSNVFGTYTLIENKFINNLIKNTREKFGVQCFESKQMVKTIYKNVSKNIQGAYLLISDQSPMLSKKMYWSHFLNVKVPIHTGTETMAKKFDLVVINWSTTKIRRGFYQTEFKLITDKPKEEENFYITNKYIELTENQIKKQPSFYLWSHNRFKHKNSFKDWEKENLPKKNTLNTKV